MVFGTLDSRAPTLAQYKNTSHNDSVIKTQPQLTQSSTLPIYQANVVLRLQRTKQDLEKYLIGSLFNPRPSTLMRASRLNNLLSFPGLTTNLITKHLPVSESSLKGHLAQEKNILRTTKPLSSQEGAEDLQPKQKPNNMKTNKMMCAMFPVS